MGMRERHVEVENPIVRLELSCGPKAFRHFQRHFFVDTMVLKLCAARLEQIEKGGFKHFMLKEIMARLRRSLCSRDKDLLGNVSQQQISRHTAKPASNMREADSIELC